MACACARCLTRALCFWARRAVRGEMPPLNPFTAPTVRRDARLELDDPLDGCRACPLALAALPDVSVLPRRLARPRCVGAAPAHRVPPVGRCGTTLAPPPSALTPVVLDGCGRMTARVTVVPTAARLAARIASMPCGAARPRAVLESEAAPRGAWCARCMRRPRGRATSCPPSAGSAPDATSLPSPRGLNALPAAASDASANGAGSNTWRRPGSGGTPSPPSLVSPWLPPCGDGFTGRVGCVAAAGAVASGSHLPDADTNARTICPGRTGSFARSSRADKPPFAAISGECSRADTAAAHSCFD